ncbi:inosine-5'-monophosphate dehydrogenase [Streptomyces sp. Ru71]|uniref:CBS domain-containing protein n=1 Tax=Streptomyces sp. Ru71 TaxID=2080746 RepID=UPI000CDE151B|nr:CBS domain-containing protein [Streptomyces sp. Ru71]POX57265.1 inosine-5'-monophosphate dehydrogenase [Streptomyces sp. Ru71]
MRHRTVGDLMTHRVVRVERDTPFKAVVRLLSDADVTALPVVDGLGHPVGVVSEADVLRTIAARPDPAGLPLGSHGNGGRPAVDRVTAEVLMTAPAVCARPEWTVVEAARVMEASGVKRLPVVDETDALVGIVSRGDLLRVFLRRDDALRDEIAGDVLSGTLGLAPADVAVDVREGRVTLKGHVAGEELIPVITRLCLGVDGVVSVAADLSRSF